MLENLSAPLCGRLVAIDGKPIELVMNQLAQLRGGGRGMIRYSSVRWH